MSLITSLTRAWLTRSLKPFRFTSEYDENLPYFDCEALGLYVHIPFCRSICGFCPYCKTLYNQELCDRYIDALLCEIEMAGDMYAGKKQTTSLYFGGGTPALAAARIKEITVALKRHFTITQGIGIELHPNNITPETLGALKDAGITKISIGIQSFNDKFAGTLGRAPVNPSIIKDALSRVPFETVSMDFIFALPGQTANDLISDVETAFSIGANHIAAYPFIAFTFTEGKIPAMKNADKKRLLDEFTRHCAKKGYRRGSIWTFYSANDACYSSMTRDNFLGFGCSATTLLNDRFKINTFSVDSYCDRIKSGMFPTSLTIKFTPRQRMVYYLFWTAYGMEVDPAAFEKFFGVKLRRFYGAELKLFELSGFVKKDGGVYRLTEKGAFYFHFYENFYTLAYIDKMWGIMRRRAFPDKIEF